MERPNPAIVGLPSPIARCIMPGYSLRANATPQRDRLVGLAMLGADGLRAVGFLGAIGSKALTAVEVTLLDNQLDRIHSLHSIERIVPEEKEVSALANFVTPKKHTQR